MTGIGIIGFAHGHIFGLCNEWIDNCEKYGVEVICGYDRDSVRAKSSCEKLNIKLEADVCSLLARDDIAAVVIACETAYHSEMCVLAAQAKKDIVLYKPMALNMQQAKAIADAVEQNAVRFTLAWQMRCDSVNLEVKRLVDSNELGKIYHYRRRHSLAVHNDPGFKSTWHVNPSLNRDIFADDSAHPTDLVNFMFGLPQSVMCEISTVHSPNVPNNLGVALFRYPNGMIAEVSFCASCSAAKIAAEGYFEKGAFQQYGGDGPSLNAEHSALPSLEVFRTGEQSWSAHNVPLPSSQWDRIVAQSKPLADFIIGQREAICTASEGMNSLRMVIACYLSCETGERIMLDDKRIENFR